MTPFLIWYGVCGIVVMIMFVGNHIMYELMLPRRIHIAFVFILWPVILVLIMIGVIRFYRNNING